ncbi:MAG: peptide-methionine (S)-S-oxide reductase MsrA [Dokdonella sp.]
MNYIGKIAPRSVLYLALSVLTGMLLWQISARSEEAAVVIPPPVMDEKAPLAASEKAVFAGGCFWGVQGVYQHVTGVIKAVSGYAGGTRDTANYQTVGSGSTGHAESVEITYNPRQISYGQLLQIYFSVAHNPTELNRQGPDGGTQYRSTIFVANDEQAKVASAYIAQLKQSNAYGKPIVTTVERGKAFYPAEAYHQDYLTLNPDSPYIAVNDLPKIENLKRVFPDHYRQSPALVRVSVH